MQLNPQFQQIGEDFAHRYYQASQNARAQLGSFYLPEAMVTYEREQLQGREAIQNKFSKITGAVQYNIAGCDCQPTPNGGVIVVTQGDISIDGGHGMRFSQSFHLVSNGAGGFSVINDVFRFCFA